MKALYSASVPTELQERTIENLADVEKVIKHALATSAEIGNTAVSLEAGDETALVIGLLDGRAYLCWSMADGRSQHSVDPHFHGPDLAFDFFGSYTEVAAGHTVSMARAFQAIQGYLLRGSPECEGLTFEYD
jgi:hypothetical protein